MANAVTSATNAAIVVQTQSTQNTQNSKPPANNSAAPQDKVTISQAGRTAQQATQTSGDTEHDGDSK